MDIVLPHFAKQNEVKRCPFKTFFRHWRRWNREYFLHNPRSCV